MNLSLAGDEGLNVDGGAGTIPSDDDAAVIDVAVAGGDCEDALNGVF